MRERVDANSLPTVGASTSEAYPRRRAPKAGAGLAALGAAAPALIGEARAQADDPDLGRLLSQRRILLKGGVVLTLDRAVGDFARADVLIEDGKIREVRPDIAAAADAAAVADAGNR